MFFKLTMEFPKINSFRAKAFYMNFYVGARDCMLMDDSDDFM